jgi:hypothetical protein
VILFWVDGLDIRESVTEALKTPPVISMTGTGGRKKTDSEEPGKISAI